MTEIKASFTLSLVVTCTNFGSPCGCSMAELVCMMLDSLSPFANLFSRIHKVRVVLCCASAAIDRQWSCMR